MDNNVDNATVSMATYAMYRISFFQSALLLMAEDRSPATISSAPSHISCMTLTTASDHQDTFFPLSDSVMSVPFRADILIKIHICTIRLCRLNKRVHYRKRFCSSGGSAKHPIAASYGKGFRFALNQLCEILFPGTGRDIPSGSGNTEWHLSSALIIPGH